MIGSTTQTISVDIYNTKGEIVGSKNLNPAIFGIEASEGLIHQAVVAQMANIRPNVADTKRRDEVRGGGKKPWKQKGTGRARHGSIRSPLWRGGGVVFGPSSDRNFSQKVNKKVRRKALCAALSEHVRTNSLFIIDGFEDTSVPKTKVASTMLHKLPVIKDWADRIKPTIMVVSPSGHMVLQRSLRNIPSVTVIGARNMNIIDIVKHRALIVPSAAIDELEVLFSQKEVTTESISE